jgi:hypothetical protein
MNQQSTRTLIFVGVAAVCVAGAFGTSAVNRPAKLDDTVQVGEQFYPEFTDPTKATSLRVAHYDKDSTQVKLFNVEFKNGLWRIPSHHDYPADGEKQLADTAGSVIGIERGAYSGKSPDDQKRLGVLDPLDESVTGSEGRGDRITLTEGDKVVVDFIIGKPVPDMENTYYVRRADEPRVYRAKLDNLKVSTKFSDWIEQDLLEVQSSKITDLVVNRYHVDESRGAIVQEEVNHLLKDDKSTWALEGLNAETEKVKTSTVSSMTYALQDLKIVGVRPKPAGLSAALRGEEGGLSQFDIIEMQQRGFYVAGGDLVSNEGEILAGTNEGIRYTLRFGKVFTGSDIEIEAGNSHDGAEKKTDTTDSDGEKTDAADADAATTPADDADAEPKESDESDTSLQKSRYVLIRAQFDESLLGARPVAPVKPEPPGEAAASEADPAGNDADQDKPAEGSAATDQPEAAQPEKTEATQPEGSVDDPKTEGTDETRPDAAAEEKPAETKPDPKAEYDAALKKYEADQRDFEQKNKAFDEKIAAGKKLAAELDLRFANWYYVIDAAQFDKLHVQRADLVEPKEPPKTTTPAAGEASPGSGAAATSPPAPPTVEAGETPKTDDAVKPEGSPAEKTPPGGADPPKADGDAAAPAADNKTDAPAGEKLPESRGEAPPAGGAKPPADNDSPPGQAP